MEIVGHQIAVTKVLLKTVKTPNIQLEKMLWEKIVLELYREEGVFSGKVCELVGITKWDFAELLREKRFRFPIMRKIWRKILML